MTAQEEWRPVTGHPGYEVSSHGRVRSYRDKQGHPTREPRLMDLQRVQGYLYIKLGRSFQTAVHRLVAREFLGPTPPGMECRHLDGNRENAALTNLAYGSRSENYHDRHAHGTDISGERHGNAKLSDKDVIEMRRSKLPPRKVAEHYGMSLGNVYKILGRRAWRHLP